MRYAGRGIRTRYARAASRRHRHCAYRSTVERSRRRASVRCDGREDSHSRPSPVGGAVAIHRRNACQFSASRAARVRIAGRLSGYDQRLPCASPLAPACCGVLGMDSFASVARDIRACRRCPGMNTLGETESAPGHGSESARVIVVGQSLCGPCMATQVPFTGGSGRLLDRCFERANVLKSEVFTTNVVHCHPPGNRPSLPHEVQNCFEYLKREIALLTNARLIVALGRDAENVLRREMPKLRWIAKIEDLSAHELRGVAVPHPAFIMRQRQCMRDEYVTRVGGMIMSVMRGRAL